MLKYRLITACILIPIIIAALFLLPLLGFELVMFTVCMLSIWEWGQLAGFTNSRQRIWLTILVGLLLSLMMFTMPIDLSLITIIQVQWILWAAFTWWLGALLLVICYNHSATFWYHSRPLLLIYGGLTIIPFFWSMLILRQYDYTLNHHSGAWWLLYVILLVWSADSGAYLFGSLLGSHKLAPKVSPSKTWEGLAGGLITSAIITWLFSQYAPLYVSPVVLIIVSAMAVLASVLGDLTESMLKRAAGIKDSGYLIPGHGGILDRIDSLTAAVPIFVCLIFLVYNAI